MAQNKNRSAMHEAWHRRVKIGEDIMRDIKAALSKRQTLTDLRKLQREKRRVGGFLNMLYNLRAEARGIARGRVEDRKKTAQIVKDII